jgi:hypothetical protein
MGSDAGAAEIRAFCGAVVGGVDVRSVTDGDGGLLRPVRWSGRVPGLGMCMYNADGFLRFGGSLAKFRQRIIEGVPDEHTSNDHVLTARQVNETVQALFERAELAFPFVEPLAAVVNRVDVVYQRPVRSSLETLQALRGAMKQTRLGCAWFDNRQGAATGLHLRGGVVSHREYDKGLESGNEAYLNVLRSEEQLRRKAAAFSDVFCLERREFDRDACRQVLNDRYIDVAYGQELDVSGLITSGSPMMALLVLHPEYAHHHKSSVKRDGHYKMMKKVREFRASVVPDDLRVPEDAWVVAAA